MPNVTDIPNYVSADSPSGLRRAMMVNSARRRYFFKYTDIQFVNGRWYAWFISRIFEDDPLMDVNLNEEPKDDGGKSE